MSKPFLIIQLRPGRCNCR